MLSAYVFWGGANGGVVHDVFLDNFAISVLSTGRHLQQTRIATGSPHYFKSDVDGTMAHQQSTRSADPSTLTHKADWRENGTRHMAAQQAEQNSSGLEEEEEKNCSQTFLVSGLFQKKCLRSLAP